MKNNQGNKTNKGKHWGKGFIGEQAKRKADRLFHPYTAYDFVNPIKRND